MREYELYQAVTPGEPDGNGRSCLIGAIGWVEVDEEEMATEGVNPSSVRVLGQLSQYFHPWIENNTKDAHRSRGRLENLRLAACVTADMTDSSMSWAAKMEDIESSKEAGSSTSAGTRLFKSSTARVWFGTGVEVKVETGVWRMDVDSGSSDTDARGGGVSNLTTGLAYGRGRLLDGTFSEPETDVGEKLTCPGSGVFP